MVLSIFMPFYGDFDHLKSAVQSVMSQDSSDWTLAVLDDCYPDSAPGEWVKSISDSRVRYVRNQDNLRPSRNYNKAVSSCETEYLTIMGCDDLMLPNYVSRVLTLVKRFPEAKIIQPGVSIIDENGASVLPLVDRVKRMYSPNISMAREIGGEELAVSLLRGNWTYFPSLVWRADLVKAISFRTDLNVVQDLAMLLQIALRGGAMAVDSHEVFLYRRHSKSFSAVSAPDGSKFGEEFKFFKEIEKECRLHGWKKASRVARLHLSSRLHALVDLPLAIRAKNAEGSKALLGHIFGF